MKKYIAFNPQDGYPVGPYLIYECQKCGDAIPSIPRGSTSCSCGNFTIDKDAGRISVKDESMIKLYEK